MPALYTQHAYTCSDPTGGDSWTELVAGCPACGHAGWCRISPDGAVVACRRLEDGCFLKVEYRDGTPAYLHSLRGDRRPAVPHPERVHGAERAPDADLDRVYRALLTRLPLEDRHRAQLRRRGLDDEALRLAGYRSMPSRGRAALARELLGIFPEALLARVPGLVTRHGERGDYLSVAGWPGLVVPVRDPAGLVVGLQVRPDSPPKGTGKYVWLSSRPAGGPSSSARVHVPLACRFASPLRPGRVVLVEGALKADVACSLSGRPVVGLPACHVTREAVEVLQALRCGEPILALDSDSRTNPAVALARREGLRRLRAAWGERAGLLEWPPEEGKGLDDWLLGRLKK